MNSKNIINRLFRYLKDQLSNKDRYEVEKEISADPFLSDAMDGFSTISADELESDLSFLDERLDYLLKKKKRRSLIPIFSVAAGVAVLLGIIGLWFIQQPKQSNEPLIVQVEEKNVDTSTEQVLPFEQLYENTQEPSYSDKQKTAIAKVNKQVVNDSVKHITSGVASGSDLHVEAEVNASPAEPLAVILDETEADMGDEAIPFEQLYEAPEEVVAAKMKQPLMSRVKKQVKTDNDGLIISGTVYDSDGYPAIGATVLVKGTTNGTATDFDGKFSIKVNTPSDVLVISSIGYASTEIIATSPDLLAVTLEEDRNEIKEVVKMGYLVARSEDATAAITSVGSEDVEPKLSELRNPQTNQIEVKETHLEYAYAKDRHAEPFAGIKKFNKYLNDEIRVAGDEKIRIVLSVEISEQGFPQNIKIIQENISGYADQVIDLINKGGKWMPAEQDGRPVQETVLFYVVLKKR